MLCGMTVDKETMTRLKDYKDEQRGLSTSKVPQNYQLIKLEPFYYRRRTHILRFVNDCIANRVPRYPFNNCFNVRNRDIHRHKTRNNNDLTLEKVNLECTKRAFFYTGTTKFLIPFRI